MAEVWFWILIGWLGGLANIALALAVMSWRLDPRDDGPWFEFERNGVLYRKKEICERFEPDVSGNTAGHWDRVT